MILAVPLQFKYFNIVFLKKIPSNQWKNNMFCIDAPFTKITLFFEYYFFFKFYKHFTVQIIKVLYTVDRTLGNLYRLNA